MAPNSPSDGPQRKPSLAKSAWVPKVTGEPNTPLIAGRLAVVGMVAVGIGVTERADTAATAAWLAFGEAMLEKISTVSIKPSRTRNRISASFHLRAVLPEIPN